MGAAPQKKNLTMSIFEGLPHLGYEKYQQVRMRKSLDRLQGRWGFKMGKIVEHNLPMCLVGYQEGVDEYSAAYIDTAGDLDFCYLVLTWFESDDKVDQKLLEWTKGKEKELVCKAQEQAKNTAQMTIMERLDRIEKAIGLEK